MHLFIYLFRPLTDTRPCWLGIMKVVKWCFMFLLQTCECCIINWQACCLLKLVPAVSLSCCALCSPAKASRSSLGILLLMACLSRDMRQKSLADWKAAKDQEELEAAEWHAEQQELHRQVSSALQVNTPSVVSGCCYSSRKCHMVPAVLETNLLPNCLSAMTPAACMPKHV